MFRRFTTALCVLIVIAVISGCGSSGGGGKTGGLTGNVTGKVSSASLPSGGGNLTASIDGKNISAPVGADGDFNLPNVPPGVYTLVIKGPQSAGDVVVVVSAGGTTNVGAIDLVSAGQISGLVTDSSSGNPIAQAIVTVSDSSTANATADQPPMPVRSTITDGSGSYVMDALPSGSYLVTVDKQGYTTGTLEVTVSAGTTTAGDIHLTPVSTATGTVQGTVVETNSDGSTSPLGGVFVILSSPTPVTDPVPPTATGASGAPIILWPVGPTSPDYYAYTADDGTYSITGVPTGNYTATAIRPGFQSSSAVVSVTQSQTTTANFTLSLYQIPTATVSGTVTDSSTNAPIAGAAVTALIFAPPLAGSNSRVHPSAVALPAQPTGFNVTAVTDPSGHYSLVVPTSTSEIICSATGYLSSEQPVSVSNGSTSIVNFALSAQASQTATLSGTVTEQSSSGGAATPVAGATVTIMPSPLLIPGQPVPPTSQTYTATTDPSGNYSVTIPIGVYEVYASTTGAFSTVDYVRLITNSTANLTLVTGVPPPITPVGTPTPASKPAP